MRWLWLAGLLGCGRIGFGPPSDGVATLHGDGGGNVDGHGDSATDATTSSVCPSTVMLSDDFEDGVTAPEWTVLTATDLTVAETAGVLRVTFATNSGPTELAGYRQTTAADYTTACVIFEITAVPSASAPMEAHVGISSTNFVGFTITAGTMLSSLHNGASVMTADNRTFDPIAHRFLRVRTTTTATYWDASPDGVAYTALGTVADVQALAASTQLQLAAETLSAVQNAGKAEWASVRVLVPP